VKQPATGSAAAPIGGRRGFLAASAALALAGCAAGRSLSGAASSEEVPQPVWRVGDRWTYRRTDMFTGLDAGNVSYVVTAASPGALRIATRNAKGEEIADRRCTRPGLEVEGNLSEDSLAVLGKLEPAYERYAFPLVSGKRWRQKLTRTNGNGATNEMTASTQVEGWERRVVAGRELRTILIRRALNLGPKDDFTGDLSHYELEWYAPELRGPARLEVQEWYLESPHDSLGPQWPWTRLTYELIDSAAGAAG